MEFTFERTFDFGMVKRIISDRHIYPHVSDDLSPSAEDYQPPRENAFYLLVSDAEGHLGLWVLTSQTSTCWAVHTCLLPRAYGRTAILAARAAIAWVFANTPCTRLVTDVPTNNTLALRLAKNAQMTEYGFNPDSFVKDGKSYGQHLLGISKCQSQQ